jgi:hypothetical protein
MTVDELRKVLEDLPGDREVVVQTRYGRMDVNFCGLGYLNSDRPHELEFFIGEDSDDFYIPAGTEPFCKNSIYEEDRPEGLT